MAIWTKKNLIVVPKWDEEVDGVPNDADEPDVETKKIRNLFLEKVHEEAQRYNLTL